VRKNCNCKDVKYVRIQSNSETILDDIKSGDITKSFSMQLTDCDYNALESLQQDVLAVLKENILCETKSINFFVEDFKGQKVHFNVNDCDLILK